MTNRAVSPVLGLALLLGLTTVAALSLLVVGAVLLDDTRSSAETTQAEESMSSLAGTADRIAAGDVDRADYDLAVSDAGSVGVEEDAGFYEVRIERPNGTEVLTNGSLGSYRYSGSNGATLAFQGGGVWRADRSGQSQMVDPPQFHYRAQPEPTLTLPVVRVEHDGEVAPRDGQLAVTDRRDVYPVTPNHENPLQAGVVYVEVRSRYCDGWEHFFRGRTDGAVVETCDATGETSTDEVLVMLSVPFTFPGLGGETAVAEQISGQGTVYGSTSEGTHELESVSGVIERRIEDCADGEGQPLSSNPTGGGLYCASGMSGDYDVDTRGQDVEIVVNGTANPDELTIDGDGTVTLFAGGDVLRMPGDSVGNASRPEQLRILVHSDHQVGELPGGGGGPPGGPGAGNLDVYGLIYAPNSPVSFAGNADVHGGVVAERLHLQSSASSVAPDPAVGSITLEYERGGEPFYYLHVSETTLTVRP